MRTCRVAAIAGGVGLLVGIFSLGWSTRASAPQGQTGTGGIQIIDEQTVKLNVPSGMSDEDLMAAEEAYYNGDPLPSGVTVAEVGPDIEAYLTGIVNIQTGEQQLLVTVVDDTEDLDEVRLVFNGVQIASVDRSGGAIVDRSNGMSKATMSAFVPDPATTNPYEILLEWEGFVAQTLNSTLYRR